MPLRAVDGSRDWPTRTNEGAANDLCGPWVAQTQAPAIRPSFEHGDASFGRIAKCARRCIGCPPLMIKGIQGSGSLKCEHVPVFVGGDRRPHRGMGEGLRIATPDGDCVTTAWRKPHRRVSAGRPIGGRRRDHIPTAPCGQGPNRHGFLNPWGSGDAPSASVIDGVWSRVPAT